MPERIHVVGVGPGGPADRAVLATPDLVVGGTRHLDAWVGEGVPTVPIGGDVDAALDRIARADGHVVVLASGDPGFFGIVRALAERFGREALHVVPAVSSVALVCAAAGVSWDDALVVSAHGRDPATAVAACRAHPKVVVLTDPDSTPAALARALTAAGATDRHLVVGERLGTPDERVREVLVDEAADLEAVDPNVVLVLDPARAVGPRPVLAGAVGIPDGWALPADAFGHRDKSSGGASGGMISKPEVRALALPALAPRPGRTCWDVGTGSGAVAVELARFGAAVHAVDRDRGAVDHARANAARHGVEVDVRQGHAPDVLAELPDPHAVFVGGGGADLGAILDVVTVRARHRAVVALATVERVGPALDRFAAADWRADARLVQVADLAPLGDGHRLAPRNPVVLVTAERAP